MLKWFGKMVAEKTVGMILFLVGVLIVILVWRYHHLLPSLSSVGTFLLACLAWLISATLLPWATFFLVLWVRRFDNNVPAVLLLVFWALVDAFLAWALMGGGRLSVVEWVIVALAFCLGGLYNLIAAHQIANRLQA